MASTRKQVVVMDVYSDDRTCNGVEDGPASPPPSLVKSVNHTDFVTVVSIEDGGCPYPDNYVTVLQVNEDEDDTVEEIMVYRLPGERLGMALKFVGGTAPGDFVSRVFIQSINQDSPASRAQWKLSPIQEGDEILQIGDTPVTATTRLDCVTLLRDAPVCIRMVVRHAKGPGTELHTPHETQQQADPKKGPPPIPPRSSSVVSPPQRSVRQHVELFEKQQNVSVERSSSLKRPSMPPPLPPRRPKSHSCSDSEEAPFPGMSVSMRLPGWEELMRKRNGDRGDRPIQPDVYVDLLAEEERRLLESESDDTGSSVSTVIERCSRASTANSSFSEHTRQQSLERPPFDLEKVLGPFEQLERELDGERETCVDDDQGDFVDDPGILNDGKDALCEVLGLPSAIAPPELFQDMSQAVLCHDSLDGISSEDSEEGEHPEDSFPNSQTESDGVSSEPVAKQEAINPHVLAAAALDSLLCGTSSSDRPTSDRYGHQRGPLKSSREDTVVADVVDSDMEVPEELSSPREVKSLQCSAATVLAAMRGLTLDTKSVWGEASFTALEMRSTNKDGALEDGGLRHTVTVRQSEFCKDTTSSDEESHQVFQSSASVVVTTTFRLDSFGREDYAETADRNEEEEVNSEITSPQPEESAVISLPYHTEEADDKTDDAATCEPRYQDSTDPSSPILEECEDAVSDTERKVQELPAEEETKHTANDQQTDSLTVDLLDQLLCPELSDVPQQQRQQLLNAGSDGGSCETGLTAKGEGEESLAGSDTVGNEAVKESDQLIQEPEHRPELKTEEPSSDQMSICESPVEPFPSLQRLPPDGHEFPPAYMEPEFKREELQASPVEEPSRRKIISPTVEDSGIFTDDPLSSLSASDGEEKTKTMITAVSRQGDGEAKVEKPNSENLWLQPTPAKSVDDVKPAPPPAKIESAPSPSAGMRSASELVPAAVPQFSTPLFRSPERRTSLAEATQKRYSGILASMLETTKFGTTSKLKGLVIPDKPKVPTGVTKTLPVIVSNSTSNAQRALSSSDEEGPVRPKLDRTHSLSSNALLSDALWKSSETTDVPKYSPAFKRRSLQVSKCFECQPAKPAPAAQNGFQFSLSHSKPVTPVLPETPVMSPQPLCCGSSSDVRSRSNSTSSSFSSLSCNGYFNDNAKKNKVDPLGRLDTLLSTDSEKHKKQTSHSTSAATITNGTATYTQSPLLERYLSSSTYDSKSPESSEGEKRVSRHNSVNGSCDIRNGLARTAAPEVDEGSDATAVSSQTRTFTDHRQPPQGISSETNSSPVKEAPVIPTKSKSSTLSSEFHTETRRSRRASDILPLKESKAKFSSMDDQSWTYQVKRSYFDPSRRISAGSVSNLSIEPQSRDSKESAAEAWQKSLRVGQLGQQKTVLKKPIDSAESARSFKALAQKWEQRSLDARAEISSSSKKEIMTNGKLPPQPHPKFLEGTKKTSVVPNGNANGNATAEIPVKLRHTKVPASRPVSMFEERDVRRLSADWSDSVPSVYLRNSPVEKPTRAYRSNRSGAPSLSVTDIKKAFEGETTKTPPRTLASLRAMRSEQQPPLPEHRRFSSIDSNDSGHSSTSREQYSSMTSLASTSSLISPQELQQLIDEANQSLDEAGAAGHDIHVVILHKESPTSGVGVTLAGGSDYEAKEITVHKVIVGGLADRDGRIRKSDRILSINGKTMKGMTHREAIDILKAPRQEVVLVISREGRQSVRTTPNISRASSLSSVLDVVDDSDVTVVEQQSSTPAKYETITLVKDGLGLGFTLEGGKDSPLGDRPLVIKRIFKGGAAERDGRLQIGSELVAINEHPVAAMTRTEAWNFLKKVPDGPLTLQVSRRVLVS